MTIGIYKYENKINGTTYIGQSTNIEKRFAQHLYSANYNPVSTIDKAIEKYGIENFSISIIEECEKENLDDREIYWIKYYDSYHNGYNNTIGGKSCPGEKHPRAFLTNEDVYNIRELYAQGVPFRKAYELYIYTGISQRGFKHIWAGDNWPTIHYDVYTEENKAKQKNNAGHPEDQLGLSPLDRAISQDEIDLFVKDFKNGMNINQISKKYNRDFGIVEKYIHSPHANQVVKYQGRTVKNINTDKIFSSINSAAKWSGCGATTLTRHLVTDKKAGHVPETGEIAEWEEIL